MLTACNFQLKSLILLALITIFCVLPISEANAVSSTHRIALSGEMTFQSPTGEVVQWQVDRLTADEGSGDDFVRTENVYRATGESASINFSKIKGKETVYEVKQTADGFAETERIQVFEPNVVSRFTYKSKGNRDVDVFIVVPKTLSQNTRAISIIHDSLRYARSNLAGWVNWSIQNDYVAIAPQFPPNEWSYTGFSEGNMFSGVDGTGVLNEKPQWTFTIIDDIMNKSIAALGLKNTTYDMFGHSGGGRFIHRFMMFLPESRIRFAFPANPGLWTLPSISIDFPWGVRHKNLSYTEQDVLDWTNRKMIIARGMNDTRRDYGVDTTPEGDLQGPNRFLRAELAFDMARVLNPELEWEMMDVPNCGHSDICTGRYAQDYIEKHDREIGRTDREMQLQRVLESIETITVADENRDLLSDLLQQKEAVSRRDRATNPREWALAQSELGNALQALGTFEGGDELLDASVTAYRTALKHLDDSEDSFKVAEINNNIGTALQALGGQDREITRMQEAVAAYSLAAELLDREQTPLEWAMVQHNMGLTLRALGRRENKTDHLAVALKAYQSALEELPRNTYPLDFAMVQNSMGAALRSLGERASGTEKLEQAVAAYKTALEIFVKEDDPFTWATTYGNLGTALRTLGERMPNDATLHEAIAAFETALTVLRADGAPLEWAIVKNNMGTAYRALGERNESAEYIRTAIALIEQSLTVRTEMREQVPMQWATSQSNLGTTYRALAQVTGNIDYLEQAKISYSAALEEYTRARIPFFWAIIQNNLGATLYTLGQKTKDNLSIKRAVLAYQAALKVRTKQHVPQEWAVTQSNIATAMRVLGQRENNLEYLQQALNRYKAANQVFQQADSARYSQATEKNIRFVERLMVGF
jgi:tetratricopeptide (TPR) repeat protein